MTPYICEKIKKRREHDKERYKNPERRKQLLKSSKKWVKNNPEKRKEVITRFNQKESTKIYKRKWHEKKNFNHTGLLIDKRCAVCDSNKSLLVHHIDGDRNNNDLKNLVVLCRRCHPKFHNKWWLKEVVSNVK